MLRRAAHRQDGREGYAPRRCGAHLRRTRLRWYCWRGRRGRECRHHGGESEDGGNASSLSPQNVGSNLGGPTAGRECEVAATKPKFGQKKGLFQRHNEASRARREQASALEPQAGTAHRALCTGHSAPHTPILGAHSRAMGRRGATFDLSVRNPAFGVESQRLRASRRSSTIRRRSWTTRSS